MKNSNNKIVGIFARLHREDSISLRVDYGVPRNI
jgi:hypothetical protein